MIATLEALIKGWEAMGFHAQANELWDAMHGRLTDRFAFHAVE